MWPEGLYESHACASFILVVLMTGMKGMSAHVISIKFKL